ncbi:ATP/GTP-binding protein [Acidocella sp.]|uniref:GTP-binding protein n=1 Tax=Acidocella sp. TaxID=50710 RepID=UPI00262A5FB8|nr:ATP/GTP-binding protein [Acidocella sp.]
MDIVVGQRVAPQVIFAGPMGVGKTTAMRAVSGPEKLEMDVRSLEANQEMRAHGKTTTTAGFDYGECSLPDGRSVVLYGLPGQERFELMWNMLTPGSAGIVLWVFGDRADGGEICAAWLRALARRHACTRLVVAVSRLALAQRDEGVRAFAALARHFHPHAAVLAADPRAPEDVMQTLAAVLSAPAARFLAG